MPGVLVLAGPTASGKTELAIALARRYGAEIVGADSRQIYRDMPIGTATPSAEQLRAVPHHLIGILDPRERYSAARYSEEATEAVRRIHARGRRAIVAGGTGFYVRALTGAVELAPQFDETVRARLAREVLLHDAAFLYDWLALRDPRRAAAIHPGDVYRIARALEIALAPRSVRRAQPVESLQTAGIPFLKIALRVEPQVLEARIARRTDAMLAAGFVEEAERIGGEAVAGSAVGYPQALAFTRGWCTREELRALLFRATRRYAKRQLTWLRAEPGIVWSEPGDVEGLARERLGWV